MPSAGGSLAERRRQTLKLPLQTLTLFGGRRQKAADSGGGSAAAAATRTVSCQELAAQLEQQQRQQQQMAAQVLLLDCRSFFAYNRLHIVGAINAHCAIRCSQRRLTRCGLGGLLESDEARERLRRASAVVVYDERSADPQSEPVSVILAAVATEGKQAMLLEGGMETFAKSFDFLCASSTDTAGAVLHCRVAAGANAVQALSMCRTQSELMDFPPTRVLAFLYLGNERDAQSLDALQQIGVTHVLNATTHVPCYHEGSIHYQRIPVADSCQQDLRQYFDESFRFIDGARRAGGKVLVHCHAGVSRSATIAIAYILEHSRMSMLEAYDYVKQRRDIISPNLNFMGQLVDYERMLGSTRKQDKRSSMALDDSSLT